MIRMPDSSFSAATRSIAISRSKADTSIFGKMYAYATGRSVTADVPVNAYYLFGIGAIPRTGRAS
jgi:hypothetical protein